MTINPTVYKYRKTKDGHCPISIRVSAKGETSYIPMGIRVTLAQWDDKRRRVRDSHPNAGVINQLLLKKAHELENKYLTAQLAGVNMTPADLANAGKMGGNLYDYFEEYIAEMHDKGSHRTAITTKSMLEMMRLHRPEWPLADLTVESLRAYEKFLREKRGNGPNSISSKLAKIAAVAARLVERRIISADSNPCTVYRVTPKKTQKRILSDADMEKLWEADLSENPQFELSRDMFLFLFYAAGMRWGDCCRLKWENIREDRLVYTMHKTGKHMDLLLVDRAQEILSRYRTAKPKSGDYIFPILNPKVTDAERLDRDISIGNGTCRQHLEKIAKKLSLSVVPRPHDARHKFTQTVLPHTDIHTAMGLVGHSNMNTTQVYAGDVNRERTDKALSDTFKTKSNKLTNPGKTNNDNEKVIADSPDRATADGQ